MGRLALKRAHAPPEQGDGKRILVDRLWPRGLRRSAAALDDWMKDIAPSPALRKLFDHDPARFAALTDRYREELDANPAPVERLCTMWDPLINHARVLADYLAARMRAKAD